ncbi:MAG TPA: ribose 5-phosphate isomerase A [Candidatus Acidoferrum sp.]|jgi:ribose 5-phosphate isomerase A|nr:ribose 5-phosphate isomerase A [Candidatus Acidoferrum sp.]
MNEKERAAASAAELVKNGMVIGLGSGSTAEIAIRILGEKVKSGLQVIGVPTSHKSEMLAHALGIRLATLEDYPALDLTIDGADEVELGSLDLIKGRGGALLREKIVARSSRQLIIVVDESKIVNKLGSHGEVPVEIVSFGWQSTAHRVEKLGWTPVLRSGPDGAPFVTDGGHYILDCSFEKGAPIQLRAVQLHDTVGVVEHGMFLGMATEVHVGNAASARILRKHIDTAEHQGSTR